MEREAKTRRLDPYAKEETCATCGKKELPGMIAFHDGKEYTSCDYCFAHGFLPPEQKDPKLNLPPPYYLGGCI